MPGGGGADTLIWMGQVFAIWQYNFFNRGEYWRGQGAGSGPAPTQHLRDRVPSQESHPQLSDGLLVLLQSASSGHPSPTRHLARLGAGRAVGLSVWISLAGG